MPVTMGGVRAVVPIVALLRPQILLRLMVVPRVVVAVALAEKIPATMILVVAVVLMLEILLMLFWAMIQPCEERWWIPSADTSPLPRPANVELVVRLLIVLFDMDQLTAVARALVAV